MIAGLIILWIIFSVLTDGTFLSARNISNLTVQMSVVSILATGMVLIIVTGNIDLSVGSLVGLVGGVAAALMAWEGGERFQPYSPCFFWAWSSEASKALRLFI